MPAAVRIVAVWDNRALVWREACASGFVGGERGVYMCLVRSFRLRCLQHCGTIIHLGFLFQRPPAGPSYQQLCALVGCIGSNSWEGAATVLPTQHAPA
jgi:hypothetical protein